MMIFALLALMAAAPPELVAPPTEGSIRTEPFTTVAVSQRVPVDIDFDNAGKLVSCRVTKESKSPKADTALCADFLTGRIPISTPPKQGRASTPEVTKLILIDSQVGNQRHGALLNMGEVFSTEDYPAEALRKDEQGSTRVMVSFDATGHPTACKVTRRSGSASLDAATCSNLLEAGRFQPKLDRRGRAVPSKTSVYVRWVLPDEPPTELVDRRSRTVFAIGPDGKVGACRDDRAESEHWSPNPCDILRSQAVTVVAGAPEIATVANKQLVFEDGLLVGDIEGVDAIGKEDGVLQLRLSAIKLTIAADGGVTECEDVIGEVEQSRVDEMCRYLRKTGYVPLDPAVTNRLPRHAVSYFALYLKN